jgi:Uma2 family endonuclease
MIVRAHHRFDVAEYEEMIEHGILTEEDHVELIHGEILQKMTVGDRHAACVKRLNRILSRVAGDHAIVSIQDPIRLFDSVPEPDVALLRPRADFYATAKPVAEDVLLVIEVADSSLDFDREVKLPLYARAGIPEFWLVNLVDDTLEFHSDPSPDGTYAHCNVLSADGLVATSLLPGILTFTVREIL